MKKPSDASNEWESLREKIIGLGERSVRKSYYPELEKRLAELERFRTLLDQSNDLIFLVRIPSGRLVDINESVGRQFGHPREELLAMSVRDFVPQPIWEKLALLFVDEGQVGQAGKTFVTTFSYDGREMPVEMSMRLVAFRDAVYAVIVARDITERKQAEEALRESEEKYRRIVDTAVEGIWMLGPDTLTTFVNARMAEMLGLSTKEMIGRPMTDFMFEEDAPDHLKKMVNHRRGVSEHYQRRLRREDGETVWTLASATPTFDAEHKFAGSFAMFTDITEQYQAAEEIRESRRQVLDILESITDGFYALDNDWRFTYINRKAEELLHIRRENLLFRSIWQVLSKEEDPVVFDKYHLAKQQMKPITFEEFVSRLNKWLEMHVYPYENGLSVYLRDVTDRKQTEKALRESEELNRLTLSSLTDAVFVTDDAGSFVCIYPNVDIIFGYSLQEVRAMGNIEYLLGKGLFLPAELEAAQRLINIEREIIDKSGKTHVLLVNIVRVSIAGGTRLYICRDITERKKAEAALLESEQRYRSVFENSPVSIWEEDFSEVKTLLDSLRKEGLTDIETYFDQRPEAVRECASMVKIVDVNRAALVLHEAASKDELKAGLINTFTSESFDAFRRELVCLWNGGTEMASDTVVKTLAGDSRNVTVYFSVPPGYENTFSKVIVSLIDITERKKSEEQLALLSFALNHMREVFALIDEDARFLYVNDVFYRMLGYSIVEQLKMTLMDISPDWTTKRWSRLWLELRERGSVDIKARLRRKDVGLLMVEVSFNYFEYEGKSYGIILLRDIIERKQE